MAQQPRTLDPSRSPRDLFGVQLRILREGQGLSQQQLGPRVHVTAMAIGHYERGRTLPDYDTAAGLDHVLGARGLLLACWELAHHFHTNPDATGHANNAPHAAPAGPGDAMIGAMGIETADPIGAAALTAADFGAWAETAGAGEVTVATLHLQVRALAQAALERPPAELIAYASDCVRRVYRFARAHHRPEHAADLFLLAAQLNSLLGWFASDLGRLPEAELHASTAVTCAELARDPETLAWAHAVRSKIAFWRRDYAKAAEHARRGAEHARAGTSGVMLACQLADAASKQGDTLTVLEALRTAERAADHAGTDAVGALFSCNPARHANYRCASLLEIGRHADALDEADRALMQAAGSALGFGTIAQIHVTRARAFAARGEIEGAAEAARPVLALPPERRLATVAGRLSLLPAHLGPAPSRPALDLAEEIRTYCAAPTAAAPPPELARESP